MCEIECQYKQKCISYPHKCNTCSNNKALKKDYYVPENPWYPWYPPYTPPYTYPYYWWITVDFTCDDKRDFYTTNKSSSLYQRTEGNVTCPRCNTTYSNIHPDCPYCGWT